MVISDLRHTVLKSYRRKTSLIYMLSWKQCSLPVITTVALWQLTQVRVLLLWDLSVLCVVNHLWPLTLRQNPTTLNLSEKSHLRYAFTWILGELFSVAPVNHFKLLNCERLPLEKYISITQLRILSTATWQGLSKLQRDKDLSNRKLEYSCRNNVGCECQYY